MISFKTLIPIVGLLSLGSAASPFHYQSYSYPQYEGFNQYAGLFNYFNGGFLNQGYNKGYLGNLNQGYYSFPQYRSFSNYPIYRAPFRGNFNSLLSQGDYNSALYSPVSYQYPGYYLNQGYYNYPQKQGFFQYPLSGGYYNYPYNQGFNQGPQNSRYFRSFFNQGYYFPQSYGNKKQLY